MNSNKNRMQMKRWSCCLLICLLFVLYMCPAIVYAQADAAGGQRIFDDAGLFSDAEENELQTLCTEKIAEGRLDIVVVTTESTGSKSAMAYADDFYDENGFGYNGNTGVLLLIDMGEREIWISTTGEAENYFTDRRLDALLDTVADALADGDYAYGARQFIENSAAYMYQEPDDENRNGNYRQDYADDMRYAQESGSQMSAASRIFQCLMISVVVGGLFVLILYIKQRGSTQTNAHIYLKENRYEIAGRQDLFTHTTTVRRQIQSSNSNTGSSGSRGGHVSSGGVHHGGGGRKF